MCGLKSVILDVCLALEGEHALKFTDKSIVLVNLYFSVS